jgi:putative transposase
MSRDIRLRRRRSTHLRARDYSSPGNYFVTLCTQDRRLLFGDVVDGVMRLNDAGRAVESFWNEIPRHFPHAELDEFVIMPNHLHGIIRIVEHGWPSMESPVRAIGIPIVPGMWVAGANGSDVGANSWGVGANNDSAWRPHACGNSPLQDPHPMTQIRPVTRQRPRGTSRTIGSMVRGVKIFGTRWMLAHGHFGAVWQRNYHDHIIRNERSLERVRVYIRNNPANWDRDRNNPERRPTPTPSP